MFNYFHINYNVNLVRVYGFLERPEGLPIVLISRLCSARNSLVGLAEGDDDVEPVDDDVTVLGGSAEVLGVAEVKTEVVDSGNDVSDPTTGSLQELVTQIECSGEVGQSHQGESGFNQRNPHRDGNQGQVDDLIHHSSVTGESALQLLALGALFSFDL